MRNGKLRSNRISHGNRRKAVLAFVVTLLLAAATVGVLAAYARLRGMWHDPGIVTNVTQQVSVATGTMVTAGTVMDAFGIRNGANLAEIDFDAKRRELLGRIPNIRSITVTRHLPASVDIVVEERSPAVRLGVHGSKTSTGRVADLEGVVFTCRRKTGTLPLIREREDATTPVGGRLTGRPLAALRLIETAAETQYAISILEADVFKPDFILATLGDYTQAKFAWEGMDEPTPESAAQLALRLDHLAKAIRSNVGYGVKLWTVTEPDKVYADTKEVIK